jgi:glyoxylate/hydroxypyruvate reductase
VRVRVWVVSSVRRIAMAAGERPLLDVVIFAPRDGDGWLRAFVDGAMDRTRAGDGASSSDGALTSSPSRPVSERSVSDQLVLSNQPDDQPALEQPVDRPGGQPASSDAAEQPDGPPVSHLLVGQPAPDRCASERFASQKSTPGHSTLLPWHRVKWRLWQVGDEPTTADILVADALGDDGGAVLWAGVTVRRAVLALFAGVDRFLTSPGRPTHVPLCRLEDAGMGNRMAEYVLWCVLSFQRHMATLYPQQQCAVPPLWRKVAPRTRAECSVGILGCGVLGRVVAQHVAALGFPTRSWNRSCPPAAGSISGPMHRSFVGQAELRAFASASAVVVCLLPATNATRALVNADVFAAMPRGSWFVNIGRGASVDDAALVAALDAGHLDYAVLDVFTCEPLPQDHPFWRHPRILVTPHVSGPTEFDATVPVVLDNIARILEGRPLAGVVDPVKGY